jgi:hypothetical protein
VVIGDLDVVYSVVPPFEADPELRVDADAVLACTRAAQCFQTVARRRAQIVEPDSGVQLLQLSHCDLLQFERPPSRTSAVLEEFANIAIPETSDQGCNLSLTIINVKRY